jgi:uncharacterized Zn finger protein
MIKENLWEYKCPNCSSSNRVMQEVIDDDRAAGRLGEKITTGALSIQELPVTDRAKQPKLGDKVSVVTMFSDICQDCGTIYVFKVTRDLRVTSIDVSRMIQPPVGKIPHFPGGLGKGN